MVDTEQIVPVKINHVNKKHYNSIGYTGEIGDIVNVKFLDLYKPAKVYIQAVCERCGETYSITYGNYQQILRLEDTRTFCKKCSRIKAQDTCEKRYGVKSVFSLEEVREKIKQHNLETYRSEYCLNNKEVQKKRFETNLQKYGSISPFRNKQIQEKSKATLKENYQVDNPSQSLFIQEKIRNSFYENRTQKASKQQRQLYDFLPSSQYLLNFPCGFYNIDIADIENQIAIEYDGGRHNLSVKLGNITESKFKQNEIHREKFLYKQNWKIITIKSINKNLIPSQKDFLDFLRSSSIYFQSDNKHWTEFDVETNKVLTSLGEFDFNTFINTYNGERLNEETP